MTAGQARCGEVRSTIAAKILARDEGSRVWARMHETARMMLIGMSCPERSVDAISLPWRSFTEAERDAMGAHARQLARDLIGVQWLR